MRVIVTGANGFIGSNLVQKFHKAGHHVIAILKDKNENYDNIKDCCEVIYADLNKIDELYEKLKDSKEITLFYHLAWIGVNGNLKADYISQIENIKMACSCAMFAKKLNCKRFLVAGTVAENSIESFRKLDKLSPGLMYSVSKYSTSLFVELLCKSIGLNYIWMQFSNIYGPNNKTGNLVSYTISNIMNDKEATFGPAEQPYDFIYIDDLIDAVYKIGIAENLSRNIYFIGSGKAKLLKEYLIEIGRLANKENLIKIGARPDDGIKYTFEMFDSKPLIDEIGDYNTVTFTKGIEITLTNF